MPRNPLDTMSLDIATSTRPEGDVWTPRQPINWGAHKARELHEEIQRMRRKGPQKIDTTSGAALKIPAGAPKQLISCQATESALAQVDRVYSQIAVSFTRNSADPNYAGTHVWVTGYHGNSQPVLVCDAADSPAIFILETTNEAITITLQPFNAGHVSAPFAGAITTRALLNGQTTAPPAPSIASQTATITSGAVTVGQQFAFAYLPATLTDVLDGYWLYKTNVHSTPGIGARWKFVKASVQNSGVYTCVDSSGVSTNFYYVSSVNKQGLESALTDAAAGGGGTVTTYRPSASTVLIGSGFLNPARVYDGNASTYSSVSLSNTEIANSWQGWTAAGGSPTAINLKVNSAVSFNSGAHGTITLSYSTNSGSTWTTVYAATATRAQQTDVIALSAAQNISTVRIKVDVNGTNTLAVSSFVYESWIEVTT